MISNIDLDEDNYYLCSLDDPDFWEFLDSLDDDPQTNKLKLVKMEE